MKIGVTFKPLTVSVLLVLNATACVKLLPAASSSVPRASSSQAAGLNTRELQTSSISQEAETIKHLIQNLAHIDHPYIGLAPSMSGSAFAPLPDSREWKGGILFINNHIQTSTDLVELVKFGPKAIPFLLASLEDKTPTKLVVRPPMPGEGVMEFAAELPGSAANEMEKLVISARPLQTLSRHSDQYLSSYTVTVGDVCFVIIGQIVNRPYEAVRYQMTACVVLNSPTHDTELAKSVRAIWSQGDPGRLVMESLMTDFANKTSRFLQTSPYGSLWSDNDLTSGAATRLLFYFPQQASRLVANKVGSLGMGRAGEDETDSRPATDFIKAVAWSDQPAVRGAVRKIFYGTRNPDFLVASFPAVKASDPMALRARIAELIAALPETEKNPYGDGYSLLMALVEQYGADAKPFLAHYVEHSTLQRCDTMCDVMKYGGHEWSMDLLAPLLNDSRPTKDEMYAIGPGPDQPHSPVRICDLAANAIAASFPKIPFKLSGGRDELDLQIKKMREQIAKHEY